MVTAMSVLPTVITGDTLSRVTPTGHVMSSTTCGHQLERTCPPLPHNLTYLYHLYLHHLGKYNFLLRQEK